MAPLTLRRTLAAAIAAVLVAGGCSGIHPRRGYSPLDVADPGGGLSIYRPAEFPVWWSTVGSILLCPREPVTLLSIEPQWDVEPRSHLVTVHRFRWETGVRATTTPIGSAKGTPPDWGEPYASELRMKGTYHRDLDGLVVRDKCAPDGKISAWTNEILVSMKVGSEGGEFHRLKITYRADGRTYTRTLKNWWYTACGTATTQPRVCPPGQQAPGVEPDLH